MFWKWLLLLSFISSLKISWSWNKAIQDDVASFLRREVDQALDQPKRLHLNVIGTGTGSTQYDLTLRRLKFGLNHTISDEGMLLTRTKESGNIYLLIGNDIARVILRSDDVRILPIAQLIDIPSEIEDFQVEEIKTEGKQNYLIVALNLPDRFQIYQIPTDLEDKQSFTINAIQKIRKLGRTTRTALVQNASDLYLVAGFLDFDAGKVAIYQWMDFHFSVKDIKDVSKHDDLIIMSKKQLVVLVFQIAEYPERSVNNIYVLNEQRKLVKTQEMYFLFDRLPYYEVNDDFYIIRCIALDKCFLYKWNGESLFLRASKVGFDPKNIEITARHNIAIVSLKGSLYFYINQPLLKIASSYAVVNDHGVVMDTSFRADYQIKELFLYVDQTTGKAYMCVLYTNSHTILDFVELQLNRVGSEQTKGEQTNFSALKTCLSQIKDMVNIRKSWIDLIKYQLSKILRKCKSTEQTFFAPKVFIADTNAIKLIKLEGTLKDTTRGILNQWKSVDKHMASAFSHSKDLFYLNRLNTIQSNVKISGSLHTKSAKMKRITVQSDRIRSSTRRYKRSSLSKTASMINAQEVVYNGKLFSNLFSRRNDNVIPSRAEARNIYASVIRLSSRTINDIPIANVLFNDTDKTMTKGHKVFKAVDSKSVTLFSVNGEKIGQRFSTLRSFVVSTNSGESMELSGVRGVNDLIINGKLNNVPVTQLLQQLYYVDRKSTIRGNIYLQSPSHIRDVHTTSLNRFSTDKFFDLRSNQTVSATILLPKTYATAVLCQTINGLIFPDNITIIGSTELINAAVASNFVVLKDLTLSTDDQHFTRHVLGTKVEDFSQIYLGRVFLKGSLKLSKLLLESYGTQLYVNGIATSTNVRNYFWMKHLEQNLAGFTFKRLVDISHLMCTELNYYSIGSYLKLDNWQPSLYLDYRTAYVKGNLKSYATSQNFLQYIYSESVQRGSMSTITGRKVFTGLLHTDTLVADVVDSINVQHLAIDTSSAAFFGGSKHMEHLIVKECIIEVLQRLNVETHRNHSFAHIVDQSVNSHNMQNLEYMIISDVKTEHLGTRLINGIIADTFIAEVDNFMFRVDPYAAQFRVENLIAKKNVISTSHMLIDYLNAINTKDYFALLTLKSEIGTKYREIGGSKILRKHIVIDGNFSSMSVNHIAMNNLLHNTVRKMEPQNIVSAWIVNKLASRYIAAKQIKDVPTKYLVNSNLQSFKIHNDIEVEAMLVTLNVHGSLFPNKSSVLKPPSLQLVTNLVVQGSLLLQHYQPGTIFIDVMLSGVTDQSSVLEQVIFFHGTSNNILHAWNDGKIFSKNCDFIRLLTDSVKRKQSNLVFSSVGRLLYDAVFLRTVVADDIIKTAFINGIDLSNLNQSIHAVGYDQEIIKSTKYFEDKVGITQFVCNDELAGGAFPHYLNSNLDISRLKRHQFQFESAVSVVGNLYVDAINDYSLQHFLASRVLKNRTYTQDNSNDAQQISGCITFSTLIASKQQNTIQTINGISLNEIVFKSSNEHQVMIEPKLLKGKFVLLGPASVMSCNGFDFLDTFKSTFFKNTVDLYFENVAFFNKGVLHNGIHVDSTLNSAPMQKMMKLRVSSVEELLPLIPLIREQLSISNGAYFVGSAKGRHMAYIETLPAGDEIQLLQSGATQQSVGISNVTYTVTFNESSVNAGETHFTLTLHVHRPNSIWNTTSVSLLGTPLRSEWKEVWYKNAMQLVVLTLVSRNDKNVLALHVHNGDQLGLQQEIQVQTINAEFQLMDVNTSSVVLVLSDLLQLQKNTVVPKLKLYSYDAKMLNFVHFLTLSGQYDSIVVIVVDGTTMIAVSENDSNILEIFATDLFRASLYQKIVFDSNIASLRLTCIQGSSVLQISTVDSMVFVYGHNAIEGWKQLSYGRTSLGRGLLP